MTIMINNASTDTVSVSATWSGSRGVVQVAGTLGGASVQLEAVNTYDAKKGMPYSPVGSAITATGFIQFDLGECDYRVSLTGGSPVGVYVSVNPQVLV